MKATKVNAGLAESNGRLLLGIWRDSLHVTCGLTACTPGSYSVTSMGKLYLYLLVAYHTYFLFRGIPLFIVCKVYVIIRSFSENCVV